MNSAEILRQPERDWQSNGLLRNPRSPHFSQEHVLNCHPNI